MKLLTIPASTAFLLVACLFAGCKQPEQNKPNAPGFANEDMLEENIPSDKYYNFKYRYPNDVFAGKTYRGTAIEFYPIGISDEGLFAYMEKPCDGGCGCCRHIIRIVNLWNDKTIAELDLNKYMDPLDDHSDNWKKNNKKLTAFLKNKRISQVPMEVDASPYLSYEGHTYEINISTRKGTNDDDYMGNETLKYVVRVALDNFKKKTVSKGEIPDGISFTYLGSLKSPYDKQAVLLFNKSYNGWEAEHVNEVVVVGCKLDPASFD